MKKKLIDKLKDFWLWWEIEEICFMGLLAWALFQIWNFIGILLLNFYGRADGLDPLIKSEYYFVLLCLAWLLVPTFSVLLFLFNLLKKEVRK